MLKRLSFAHYLLAGGAALALLGLVLWRLLPIAAGCPPFLLTPLLALGYGGYELWRKRPAAPRDS